MQYVVTAANLYVTVDGGGDGEVDAACLRHVADRQRVDDRIRRLMQHRKIGPRGVDPKDEHSSNDYAKIAPSQRH